MITAIVTILLTVLSAFLYRIGGMSKEQAAKDMPWLPQWLVNTKTRDLGCPAAAIGWTLACLPIVAWWSYLIAYVVMFGALTTYWDKVFGEDNFFAHGLGIALSLLPIVIVSSGLWVGFAAYAVVLPVLMGVWCLIFSNDYVEELGRGAFIVAALPLLLI